MANHFEAGAAIITGAASGIGRATSLAFARDGCRKLVLGDLSLEGLNDTRNLIQQQFPDAEIVVFKVDVSDEELVAKFHSIAVETFGRIDFAANVAGYAYPAARSVDTDSSEFDNSLAVNLTGVFLCERAQLRQMLKQSPLPGYESCGSIVNVGSLCSTIAMPGLTAYSASKGGVLALSKCDALDYGPSKIRINCVGPGNVITPMLKSSMGEDHVTNMAAMTPLRRLGRPEDIGNAVVWLSSPMASYLTGVFLPVDGGLSLATGPF